MKKSSLFSIFLSCLFSILLFSCSNVFFNSKSSIELSLPYKSNNGSARAADVDSEKISLEFKLTLKSSTGEETVKTAASGATVVFEELQPGVYSLECSASAGELKYHALEENIKVEAGEKTEVKLTLKQVKEEEKKSDEIEGAAHFVYQESTNAYKYYFNSSDVPDAKKGQLVKYSFSGIPTEDVTEGFNINYYGWNEDQKKYQTLADKLPITINVTGKAGQRISGEGYFIITDEMEKGMASSFDMYYSPKTFDKEMYLLEFDYKFEVGVEPVAIPRVSVESTKEGLVFTFNKTKDDVKFGSLQITDPDGNLGIKPVDYYGDCDKMSVIWPFVEPDKTYQFRLEGYFGNGDYNFEYFYAKYTGSTSYNYDENLYNRLRGAKLSLTDDENSKLLKLAIDATDKDVYSFIPTTTNVKLSGAMWSGEDGWDWLGAVTLDEMLISKAMEYGVDLIFDNCLTTSIEDVISNFETKKITDYRVTLDAFFESEKYSNQHFLIKGINSNAVTFHKPLNKVIKIDENNNYCIHHDLDKTVETGDYILLTVSGKLNYYGDTSINNLSNLNVGVQNGEEERFWENIVGMWVDLSTNLPSNKDFVLQAGFYIMAPTTKPKLQINFRQNKPAEGVNTLVIQNFEVETTIYKGKNVNGDVYSTIKLIDYSKVNAEYQTDLSVSVPITMPSNLMNILNMNFNLDGKINNNSIASGLVIFRSSYLGNIYDYDLTLKYKTNSTSYGTFDYFDVKDNAFVVPECTLGMPSSYNPDHTYFVFLNFKPDTTASDYKSSNNMIENFICSIK